MTAWTGTLPTLYAMQIPDADDFTVLADALHGEADAWTAYVPTWTGSGSNPVLNNGTLTASYKQVGKHVEYRGLLTIGSTTTFGSGFWRFSLPVTGVATDQVGVSQLLDSGTQDKAASCYLVSTTLLQPTSSAGGVTPTVPHTWATSDQIRWHISYEAA